MAPLLRGHTNSTTSAPLRSASSSIRRLSPTTAASACSSYANLRGANCSHFGTRVAVIWLIGRIYPTRRGGGFGGSLGPGGTPEGGPGGTPSGGPGGTP